MRAVWVPYLSLDQSKIGQGQEAFQKAFDEIVSQAKEYGLNTLIVHVRPFGDAMYLLRFIPGPICLPELREAIRALTRLNIW